MDDETKKSRNEQGSSKEGFFSKFWKGTKALFLRKEKSKLDGLTNYIRKHASSVIRMDKWYDPIILLAAICYAPKLAKVAKKGYRKLPMPKALRLRKTA